MPIEFIVDSSHKFFAKVENFGLTFRNYLACLRPTAAPINDRLLKTKRAARAAFTMMEVVFAMAIVGFLVVALYAAIATSVGLVKTFQENERVTQILSEKMDTIRLYNWEQVRTNGFIPANFTVGVDPLNPNSTPYYTGRVSVAQAPISGASYRSNVLQVIVNVNWVSGSRPQSRSMTTFVAKYGLNPPYL